MNCPHCGCEIEDEGGEMGSDESTPFPADMAQGGASTGSPLAAQPQERNAEQEQLMAMLTQALGGGR